MATQVLIIMHVILGTADGISSTFFTATARLTMPLFLGIVVVFLCWFRRCRLNAEVFAPGKHKYAANTTVGTWFTPGVMWWAPRRITLDIWSAGGATGSPWVINAWWAAWLAKSVGVTAYMVIDLNGNPNSPYIVLVDIVASVLAVLMIQQVTAAQKAKAACGPAGPHAGYDEPSVS
ncbi:hypothetical protein P3T37_006543 [Kitasatospora sp. MAA4]|uniref:DUF4328 domain-containing protein n=1 Tax=Kitasatospora sp. MAA4 TaxID=3035093 RepID=UPI0024738701|nr:DUF4328 domain-containing protein [Kitasatospora sp. MAA4]MDH6137111.1 hypothetical protein [Kitasatospora sp. MAA4]